MMRRMLKRAGLLLPIAVIVLPLALGCVLSLQLFRAEKVSAQACPGGTLGRCELDGYFTGRHYDFTTPGDPAPPMWDVFFGGCIDPTFGFICGIWQNPDYMSVTDAAGFIALTSTNLNLDFNACRGTSLLANYWSITDTDWDQPANVCWKNKAKATHAAFLIWSMIGRNGNDWGNTPDSNYTGVQWAKLAFPQWSNMVNWYTANGFANFNAVVAPPCVGGQTQTFNVIRYGQDVGYVLGAGCAPPAPTILFSSPSGGTFEINKTCANVKGPLTPLTSNFVITPSVGAPLFNPPDTPLFGTFPGSINLNIQTGPVTVTHDVFIRRGGVDLPPIAGSTSTPPQTYTSGAHDFTITNIPIPGLQIGDEVCHSITVSPATGMVDPSGTIVSIVIGSTTTTPVCSRFLHKPYARVFGGDVAVGAGYGTPCVDSQAGIMGFNNSIPPFGAYVGAGTSLAVYALGQVLEFSSNQILTPLNPHATTFANSGGGYASTVYGGSLSPGNVTCPPDYFALATAPIYTGNHPVAGHTVNLGVRETVYVDGNAFIKGNIVYAGGSYANISQIPSFRLVVRGNIYIEPNVTQLDGIFVAQPNPASPGTTGRIYTCADETWGAAPTAGHPHSHSPIYTPAAEDINSECTQPLTVTGAVIANIIKFTRSRGTLGWASLADRYNTTYVMPTDAGPAERFVYSPEAWLGGNLASPESDYDTLNALSPIL